MIGGVLIFDGRYRRLFVDAMRSWAAYRGVVHDFRATYGIDPCAHPPRERSSEFAARHQPHERRADAPDGVDRRRP